MRTKFPIICGRQFLLLLGLTVRTLYGQGASVPPVLFDSQFAADPVLVAHPNQKITFNSDSIEPSGRYQLEAGTHRFCLSSNAKYFTGIVIEDADGSVVPTQQDRPGCVHVVFSEGVHTVKLSHLNDALPVPAEVVSVNVDPTGPPLVNADGSPVAGYWAIQPAQGGRIGLQATIDNTHDTPVIWDRSQTMDAEHLLQFPAAKETCNTSAVLQAANSFWMDFYFSMYIGGRGVKATCRELNFTYSDQGDYWIQIKDSSGWFGIFESYYVASGYPQAQAASFHVMFRFFPDGTQIKDLKEGEVALFQSCGYTGKAAIFAPWKFSDGFETPPWDLTVIENSDITINGTAQSVRLSNNTAIFWGDGPGGPDHVLLNDIDCLNPVPNNLPYGHNFHVIPLSGDSLYQLNKARLIANGCIGCRLQGTNLALDSQHPEYTNFTGWNFSNASFANATLNGVNLTNANLSGADFTNASLTGVTLSGSTLSNVDFTGATLCGVNIHGSDQNNLVDLTNVKLIANNSCRSDLSYTKLTMTIAPPSVWKYLNLTGAVFTDFHTGMSLSSQASRLDLSGAVLAGMSFPSGVILDYANLRGADLTGTILSKASLQSVNFSGARLYGAQLTNANLEGADMSGSLLSGSASVPNAANLGGAFLKNVSLAGASLDGAQFVDANFYGSEAAAGQQGGCSFSPTQPACATAAGATMNNTNFAGAYLFGVDFSNATLQGVNFGNAILAGANFVGARIDTDKTVSTITNFQAAFLQGANLNQALAFTRVSLQGAFVDFSDQGNTIFVQLGAEHTQFAGYWNAQGTRVCAQASYGNATTVPTNNGTMTCPDGSRYGKGCGPAAADGNNPHWNNGIDPLSNNPPFTYQFAATYSPAESNASCNSNNADPSWNQ